MVLRGVVVVVVVDVSRVELGSGFLGRRDVRKIDQLNPPKLKDAKSNNKTFIESVNKLNPSNLNTQFP